MEIRVWAQRFGFLTEWRAWNVFLLLITRVFCTTEFTGCNWLQSKLSEWRRDIVRKSSAWSPFLIDGIQSFEFFYIKISQSFHQKYRNNLILLAHWTRKGSRDGGKCFPFFHISYSKLIAVPFFPSIGRGPPRINDVSWRLQYHMKVLVGSSGILGCTNFSKSD